MSSLPPAADIPPELNLHNPAEQEVAVQLLHDAYTEVVNDLQAFYEENEALHVVNTNLRFHNRWLKNGIMTAALVLVAMTIGYIVGMSLEVHYNITLERPETQFKFGSLGG